MHILSLICLISISDMRYDVIDNNSGEMYGHLYNRMYTNPKYNKVLKKVIRELNAIFRKMKNVGIISNYEKVR